MCSGLVCLSSESENLCLCVVNTRLTYLYAKQESLQDTRTASRSTLTTKYTWRML